MNITSCTFTITQEGDIYEAYCEEAKQVITGHAANGYGRTQLEAMEDAYNRLLVDIADEEELQTEAAIDAKWDELLAAPESHAFLNKLSTEALADQEADNLIPGGFDGIGEFSDELEGTIKELIAMVHKGLTEREQRIIADSIQEAMTGIKVDKHFENTEEDNV